MSSLAPLRKRFRPVAASPKCSISPRRAPQRAFPSRQYAKWGYSQANSVASEGVAGDSVANSPSKLNYPAAEATTLFARLVRPFDSGRFGGVNRGSASKQRSAAASTPAKQRPPQSDGIFWGDPRLNLPPERSYGLPPAIISNGMPMTNSAKQPATAGSRLQKPARRRGLISMLCSLSDRRPDAPGLVGGAISKTG